MKRAILVAAVLTMSSGVASAGWFAGLGIGPSANVNGTSEVDSGGRSARLLGGMRWGKLAVEGSITGQTLRFLDNILGEFDTKELAIAGKYNFPLGSNFEVFAKAGLHRTWLSHEQDPAYDASGNGLLVGGGFEYRITTPAVSGSLFVDYTHYAADVTGDRYGYYGDGVGMWMLGFTVGL